MSAPRGAAQGERIPARVWPALVLLGFSSGLPQPLVDSTLSTWLTKEGFTPEQLLRVGYVTLPYSLKVLWAPLVDRYVPPFLGRRRGWLVVTQLLAMLGIAWLAFADPKAELAALVFAATMVAFAGASQDLVVNGYTCDALPAERLGAGAGLSVWGYRGAWLVSGGLALVWAERFGFGPTYLILAGLMLFGLVGSFVASEPARRAPPATLRETLVAPLVGWRDELGGRGLALLLGFVLLYRLPDQLANLLAVPFQAGIYDLTSLGLARGGIGLLGAGLGVALAAWSMPKLGVRPALWLFALLQALSNLGYVALDRGWLAGRSGLVLVLLFENLCGSLAATAFVAYLMGFCRSAASATQYALLTTITLLGPHLLREPLGGLQKSLGWSGFFLFTALAALPLFVLLVFVPLPGAKQEELVTP